MKYDIARTCGHIETVSIFGTNSHGERDWKIAQEETKMCEECYKNSIAESNSKHGMVALVGSPKQIAWAEKIRSIMIPLLIELPCEGAPLTQESHAKGSWELWLSVRDDVQGKKQEIITRLLNQENASWWINFANRYDYRKVIKEIEKQIIEESNATDKRDESTILSTENKKYDGEVNVTIDYEKNTIFASYTKNDDFIAIMKKLYYIWDHDKRSWYRKLNNLNGNIVDRTVELCNKLLEQGFIISSNEIDEQIKEKIILADYENECTKWITVRKYGNFKGYLVIEWKDIDKNLFNKARSLKKTKYNDSQVIIPVDMWEQVIDFAELNYFKIAPNALKAIDDYKNSIEVVHVAVKKPEPEIDKLKEILESSDEVIGDLIDD